MAERTLHNHLLQNQAFKGGFGHRRILCDEGPVNGSFSSALRSNGLVWRRRGFWERTTGLRRYGGDAETDVGDLDGGTDGVGGSGGFGPPAVMADEGR